MIKHKHSFQRTGAPLLSALLVALAAPAAAQTRDVNVIGSNVKKYADGVLAMMCFSVVRDLTSSFLPAPAAWATGRHFAALPSRTDCTGSHHESCQAAKR